jgi:hypothetical protein
MCFSNRVPSSLSFLDNLSLSIHVGFFIVKFVMCQFLHAAIVDFFQSAGDKSAKHLPRQRLSPKDKKDRNFLSMFPLVSAGHPIYTLHTRRFSEAFTLKG